MLFRAPLVFTDTGMVQAMSTSNSRVSSSTGGRRRDAVPKNKHRDVTSVLRMVGDTLAAAQPSSLLPDAPALLTQVITAWQHEHGQASSADAQAAVCQQAVRLLCGSPEAPA